jgi:hypothetical protein
VFTHPGTEAIRTNPKWPGAPSFALFNEGWSKKHHENGPSSAPVGSAFPQLRKKRKGVGAPGHLWQARNIHLLQ